MTMETCEDNQDELVSVRSNKVSSKTRRTKLKLLFDEFQNEIVCLEEKVEKLTSENAKLKSANEELRQQLHESAEVSMKIATETIDGSKINNDINNVGDISTIIKLSNKLQEMIRVNENITRVNASLRKDLKSLTNERDLHLQDIAKLREENNYSRSPYSYSKYNVVSLKDKVDNYEREIQQWKNAMKRADDYIGELGKELEKYKRSSNMSAINISGENGQLKDFSSSSGTISRSPSFQTENRKKHISSLSNNSAKEALQKLVSKIDSSQCESCTDDDRLEDACSDQGSSKNPIMDLSNHSNPSMTPKPDDIDPPEIPVGNNSGELYSDPARFPACVKLLELTKARKSDESLMTTRTSPISDSGKLYSSMVSESHNGMPFWNNGAVFSNNSTSHGGPIVHHHATSNNDDRSHKADVEDDITIVLPSSDHHLSHPQPTSVDNSHSRDMLYNSPNSRSFDTNLRSRVDLEYHTSTDHLLSNMTNGDGMVVIPNPSEYSYYPQNAYAMNHHYPPMKKIKVEDVYK